MNQDKRYQVSISSTFTDLKEERQAVLKAVLELNHMPAGMELFPASDDSAWQLIKDVIDASDYYVLIVGGRYGSLDETGLGYTEKEYDCAVSSKKSVIPLLHENPDNLPRGKTETDKGTWEKLKNFRKKVESRHTCVYWSSPEGLKAKVIVGLTSAVKRRPAIGWIHADQVPSGATLADVLALRNRVAELETELYRTRTEPPPGTEDLMQGDDTFEVKIWYSVWDPESKEDTDHVASANPTWNEIFARVAPLLITEMSESDLRKVFKGHFTNLVRRSLLDSKSLEGKELHGLGCSNDDIDTCLVQLRALGLIRESDRKRSIKDTATYWALTPYGDRLMVQLRALRRTPAEHKALARKVKRVTASRMR